MHFCTSEWPNEILCHLNFNTLHVLLYSNIYAASRLPNVRIIARTWDFIYVYIFATSVWQSATIFLHFTVFRPRFSSLVPVALFIHSRWNCRARLARSFGRSQCQRCHEMGSNPQLRIFLEVDRSWKSLLGTLPYLLSLSMRNRLEKCADFIRNVNPPTSLHTFIGHDACHVYACLREHANWRQWRQPAEW